MLGLAALAALKLDYETTLACDRAADACTVTEVRRLSSEVVERFALRDLREASHKLRRTGKGGTLDCAALAVKSRSEMVEICGGAGPEYAARINAFVADRAQPRFAATLDTGAGGRMLAWFLVAFAVPPLAAAFFFLLRARRRT